MKVFLIRHGYTDGLAGEFTQTPDTPLNEIGRQQAKRVAKRMKSESFDVLYSSLYPRAIETANEIIKYHPQVPWKKVADLNEQSIGANHGTLRTAYQQLVAESGDTFYNYVPDGGESLVQVRRRAENFYRHISQIHAEQTVVLVTHGGVICSLLLHIHDQHFDHWRDYHYHNTSISVFETDQNGRHIIHMLNNIDHLDESLLPEHSYKKTINKQR